MRFLRGQSETLTDDEITVVIKVISTAQQARLSDLAGDTSISGRISMIGYILNNCIESLAIDGESIDPVTVATSADISDKDTLEMVMRIGALAVGGIFPTKEAVKK